MIVKNLRLQRAWSQEHLATLSNLSTRTIQRIEKDDNASLDSLCSLANAFEMEISKLQDMIKNKATNTNTQESSNKDIKYIFWDYKTIRFFIINILIIFINLFTNPSHLWFIYVLFGWGFFFTLKKYKKYLEFKQL